MPTRRQFLTTAAASAPLVLTGPAFARRSPGPNETIRVGLIGLGGRCKDIARTCLEIPRMRIAAVCDIFQPRVDDFMRVAGAERGWKPYTDFRAMIEREDLDAVMVETTTHARAWITCHAMAMGMDVYIEKPMCLTIAEGREMVTLARRFKRVTQVGTQQRSMPLNNWASDLVKHGHLGTIEKVIAPNFCGPVHWTSNDTEPLPEGGSADWWDVWANQTVPRPYHRALHHGWGRWWDYDGGGESFGVTGWGTHSYDQINRALGTDETGPVSVVLEEAVEDRRAGAFDAREIGPGETGAAYYEMVRNTHGPRARVGMTFASGVKLSLELDADRGPGLGARFAGQRGSIEINRDKIAADPKELLDAPGNPGPLTVPESKPHIENWLDGIVSRERCTADIEYGQRSSTLCYLVNIARDIGRVGEVLQWDPEAERFTNCDEANALLSRPRRAGYELPRKRERR